MDLMVICVEVGLGMDQALLKVADEIAIVHPELSEELSMVNLEMRVGKTRLDALRELAHRTGLDDIKALVGSWPKPTVLARASCKRFVPIRMSCEPSAASARKR